MDMKGLVIQTNRNYETFISMIITLLKLINCTFNET